MEMLLIGFGLITVVEGYLIVKQRRLLDKKELMINRLETGIKKRKQPAG